MRGRPLAASDVPAALADTDILVTATGSAVPVLRAGQLRAAREPANGRPLFVLDLGMPPNVEPAAGRLAGVTLVDLAALGRRLASLDVPGQVHQVRAIVAAEAAAYMDRQDQAAAAPVIAAMHAQIRQLADAELARLHDRLPELSEQQRAETTATVHRILRKVLHRLTVRAKEFSAGPQEGPCTSRRCDSSSTSARVEARASAPRTTVRCGWAPEAARSRWPRQAGSPGSCVSSAAGRPSWSR